MLTNLLLGALVWGPSDCPSPAQIDALLSTGVGRRLVVSVSRRADTVELEARDVSGQPLAFRVLPAQASCAALAEAVTAVITAWAQDDLQPAPVVRSATLRRPLVAEGHAPELAPEAKPPSREWAFSGGAMLGVGTTSFTGASDLVFHWPGGALLSTSLSFTAPITVVFSAHALQRPVARFAVSAGPGARAVLGGFALDFFVGLPVSWLVPLDARLDEPLQTPLSSQVMLSGLAGVRLTLRELRFAPFLRAAVELPLVSFPERIVASPQLSLSVGFAWGES